MRADDPVLYRLITPKLVVEKNIDYFFEEDEGGKSPLYQWQPKQQNNRVIAQQSVFIFGGSQVTVAAECIILKSGKSEILDSLDSSASITEAIIYPDFDGFARLHAQNKPHIKPNVQGYLQRGTEAHLEGKLDDAIVYYTEVISLQPDVLTLNEVYTKLGNAYRAKGEVNEAINKYSEAIRLEPHDAEIYNRRASAHIEKDDLDNAIKDYGKAIELEPNDRYAYNRRGKVYRIKEDFDNAIKDYSKAIELEPDDRYAYNELGKVYTAKGDFDNAIKDYNIAIQLRPDYAKAYYNRGETWLHLQEWQEAKSDLTIAEDKGVDITAEFHNEYASVEGFEQKIGIQLPPDIAALLTQPMDKEDE